MSLAVRRVPVRVGGDRRRLVGADILRTDMGENEVLRRDGGTRQPAEDGELTGVRHCIRERPLQESFGRHLVEGTEGEVAAEPGEHLVESLKLVVQCHQRFGQIVAAFKESACVSDDVGHVSYKLAGCPHSRCRAVLTEPGWVTTDGLLGSIGKSGKKMAEDCAGRVHDAIMHQGSCPANR